MSDGVVRYAVSQSLNSHNLGFPYNKVSAQLVLRRHPRYGDDLMLITSGGQLLCHSPCSALLKLDGNAPFSLDAKGPADGSSQTLFLQAYRQIIDEITRAKKLRIEVLFFTAGPRIFTFDLSGFKSKSFDPEAAAKAAMPPPSEPDVEPQIATTAKELGCMACHANSSAVDTPSFQQIADRYRSDTESAYRLAKQVKSGATSHWGSATCPPNTDIQFDEALELMIWITGTKAQ